MIRIELKKEPPERNQWWTKMVKHALSHQTMMYDAEWNRREIAKFLEENGAKLSPYFWNGRLEDKYLEFENDADVTAFLLRWS